jgi:hypothetical protein
MQNYCSVYFHIYVTREQTGRQEILNWMLTRLHAPTLNGTIIFGYLIWDAFQKYFPCLQIRILTHNIMCKWCLSSSLCWLWEILCSDVKSCILIMFTCVSPKQRWPSTSIHGETSRIQWHPSSMHSSATSPFVHICLIFTHIWNVHVLSFTVISPIDNLLSPAQFFVDWLTHCPSK